jgi:hypothetical protein
MGALFQDRLAGWPLVHDFDFDLAGIVLRESLETAVEADWGEIWRKELSFEKKTSDVLQLQV